MTANPASPSSMYESILCQPSDVVSAVTKNRIALEKLAQRIAEASTTTLVGIGSSLHVAQLVVALWRECLPGAHVSAEHAYDTAHGLGLITVETLRPEPSRHVVIVLSHRGKKRYSREALRLSKALGTYTCFITGEGVEISSADTDMHLTTVEQERSSAHTTSLLGSFAVCAGVLESLAGSRAENVQGLLEDAIKAGLEAEPIIAETSKGIPGDLRHIWLVGAGSDAVVAREIALKIKETSYVPSEGMSIEEFLHGPFQCVDASDLLIIIDTQGHSAERASSLRSMAAYVGLSTLVLMNDERSEQLWLGEKILLLRKNPMRTMNSVCSLVALQLFSYYLARHRGTNPDGFRLEDPRFKKASELIKL